MEPSPSMMVSIDFLRLIPYDRSQGWPQTPILFRTLDAATNSLLPTSTRNTWVHQPRCSAAFAIVSFTESASHGTVTFMIYRDFCKIDYRIGSGLRWVVTISGGMMSFWFRSTCIFQSQTVSRRVASTFVDGFSGSCLAFTKGVVTVTNLNEFDW